MQLRIKKYIYFIVLGVLLILIFIVLQSNNTKTNNSLNEIPNNFTILDSVTNTKTESMIGLVYDKEEHNLGLFLNNKTYPFTQVNYNENERRYFFINPTIDILESTKDKTAIMFYCGIESTYRAQVIQCDKNGVTELWNSDFDLDKIFIESSDDRYLIIIPEHNVRQELLLGNKDELSRFLSEKKEETLRKFSEEGSLVLSGVEEFDIGDFNNDGIKEFIVKRPIYWEEENSYVSSFYSIWQIDEGKSKLTKGFIIDKMDMSKHIISVLMRQDYVYDKALFFSMTALGYTNKEIEMALNDLVDRNILMVDDQMYFLNVD